MLPAGTADWLRRRRRRPLNRHGPLNRRRPLPASLIRVEPHHAVPACHCQVRETCIQAVHAHWAHGASLHSSTRQWAHGQQASRLRRPRSATAGGEHAAPTSHKSSKQQPPAKAGSTHFP